MRASIGYLNGAEFVPLSEERKASFAALVVFTKLECGVVSHVQIRDKETMLATIVIPQRIDDKTVSFSLTLFAGAQM